VSGLVACGGPTNTDVRPVVEVFGPVVGAAGSELATVLRDASDGAPVSLRYIGVTSFNEQLEDRLDRGDRPGVALVSQPGLLPTLDERGILEPLPTDVAATVAAHYPSRLVELVERDGTPNAVPVTIDVKGLIWYRPDEFAERGLEVPATLDELAALSEAARTERDGTAPWCVTMEAGASTGWVGSDWVEDYVLRRLGPEGYADWTSGELSFDDPEVAAVFTELDELLRAPGAVAGGPRAALDVPWERSATMLLDGRCLMIHQADFLRRELPDGTVLGPEGTVDFFPLPSAGEASGPPLIVGGMLAVGLDNDPAIADALDILAGADLAERLDGTGVFLSPRIERTAVSVEMNARLLDLLESATDIQFDGSDLMPAAVGTGSFWSGMRAFFAGEELVTILGDIEAGWDDTDAAP
jgi:alpha-glucoside transport system substrate-binding protein